MSVSSAVDDLPNSRGDGKPDVVGLFLDDTPAMRALRGMFCVSMSTLSYEMIVHEAGHVAIFGFEPPWDPVEVDERLMRLSPAARVREEIRAALVGARLAALCGMPTVDPLEDAVGIGVIARLNEQDNGGEVSAVLGLARRLFDEATGGGGPLVDRARAMMPAVRRQVHRVVRRTDFDGIARRVMAALEVAK